MPSFTQIAQNPKEEFEKVGFPVFAKKSFNWKWAWSVQSDSTPFRESGDTRFLNVRHTVWELYAKTCLPKL